MLLTKVFLEYEKVNLITKKLLKIKKQKEILVIALKFKVLLSKTLNAPTFKNGENFNKDNAILC